ncbi:MAG: hypothetical protein A3K19_26185 [Lentisphaerae bacterium RIFOXYB12_FULL_65_16]|nr:MAG: hypothetical protein A3K18_29650 [Lentisphaerae bacterium RIFOXYA12_64_32]OGV87764.1 MAG: hypothetical protein A3K19_26185 [Lentisphaerae bacterium RIFOXYB12_FULL_65_16]
MAPVRVKLDENLGTCAAALCREAGFDVATVHGQGLSGASDRELIKVCQSENRCLVTLDLDFSNPFLFNPREHAGIAVLRPPRNPAKDDLLATVRTLVQALRGDSIRGKLWSVQKARVREYLPRDGAPDV